MFVLFSYDFKFIEKNSRMSSALLAIQNGLSLRQASWKFSLPKSTLQRHLKNPTLKEIGGSKPVLTDEEEKEILIWITGSIQRGLPPGSLDVIEAANMVLQRRMKEQAQVLGRGWMQKFKKRHQLSYRVPEKLKKASANVTQQDIEGWFRQIASYVAERPDFLEAFSNNTRIFNADESMLRFSASAAKVLAPIGTKNLYEVTKDEKFGLTVMATFSADGKAMKPLIIYPQERISKQINEAFPHDKANCAATSSG